METILDWVDELSRTRVLGSKEPNVLGIEGFDEFYTFVLEEILRGHNAKDIKRNAAREYPNEQANRLTERLEALALGRARERI